MSEAKTKQCNKLRQRLIYLFIHFISVLSPSQEYFARTTEASIIQKKPGTAQSKHTITRTLLQDLPL